MGCGPSLNSPSPSNMGEVNGNSPAGNSSSGKQQRSGSSSSSDSVNSSGKLSAQGRPSLTGVGNSTKQLHNGSKSLKKSPLSQKSLNSRLEIPSDVQRFEISEDLSIDFAWASQRGYYPDAPNKDNQDAYSVYPTFNNSSNSAFFGVYDGHGKTGHNCAWYVRDHLPVNLAKRLSNLTNKTTAAIKQALNTAHIETNEGLHNCREVDDTLSGTTAISVLFDKNHIYVSNVGDSRAVIASRQTGQLNRTPFALSNDQTPYRKDERVRVKKYGARIASIDQIEGIEPMHENWGELILGEEIDEGGDPPRIWHSKGDYPGTAFTRSLGDSMAEEVGVTAEPEIYDRLLSKNDEIIIIASDGVFEFLTNQMVADMFELEPGNTNLLDICKSVVSRSYDMWLQYETRTDDITIIALVLNHSQKSGGGGGGGAYVGSGASDSVDVTDVGVNVNVNGIKPVRRQITRNRKIVMETDNLSKNVMTIETIKLKSYFVSKDPDEKVSILNALKSNFMFEHLTSDQLLVLIDLMKPKLIKKGEWVIRQGDWGTSLYVVQSGRYEVRAIPGGQEPDELTKSTGGELIYLYKTSRTSNPIFGELSLLYGQPRMASVIAIDNGKVWLLERQFYREFVMRSYDTRKNIIKTLWGVKLLRCLELHQFQRLADVFQEESFGVDENIINQGDQADKFYIIVSGECDVMVKSLANGVTVDSLQMRLRNNDYFGEIALLNSSPRTGTVIARTATRVLSLDKQNFDKILGPLASIIDEDSRKKRDAAKEAAAKNEKIPQDINEIELIGVVSEEATMVLSLGRFGGNAKQPLDSSVNLTLQSFIYSDVEKTQQINALVNMIKSMEIVTANIKSPFIPSIWNIIRDSNAIHLAMNSRIVGGLNDVIRYYNDPLHSSIPESGSLTRTTSAADGHGAAGGGGGAHTRLRRSFTSVVGIVESPNPHPGAAPTRPSKIPKDDVLYILGTVASALHQLHQIGIVYRAVNPGCILLDSEGTVILGDFRTSKIGVVDGKSYTICGEVDYLAPEQINQTGHGAAVDLWSLGILAFELCCGSSPFAEEGATEVSMFSKISSFGSSKGGLTNSLTYPTDMKILYDDVISLINQLVVPDSKRRLSVSKAADFDNFKGLPEFKGLLNWSTIGTANHQSPLLNIAKSELNEVLNNPLDKSISDKFKLAYSGEGDWEKQL